VAPSAVTCPHVTAYSTGLRRTGSLPVFRTRCHVRARGSTQGELVGIFCRHVPSRDGLPDRPALDGQFTRVPVHAAT